MVHTDSAAICGRVLGVDFGTKRIGIAVGQTMAKTAQPLTTVANKNGRIDWHALAAVYDEWQPAATIIGMPISMDDTLSPLCDAVRAFARQVKKRFGQTIFFVDERLTTYTARAMTLEKKPHSHKARRQHRARIDATAAAIITTDWLLQHSQENPVCK